MRLREVTVKDANFIVQLLNDLDWLKYIGDRNVKDIQDAVAYIQQGPQAMYHQYGMGLLVVELLAHQQPVGLCGLLKRIELPHPDLGFAFLPEYRNQGLALEAAKLVLADARERKLTDKVLAITSIDNHQSIKLLKKLGFNFKGLKQLSADDTENNSDELKIFELQI